MDAFVESMNRMWLLPFQTFAAGVDAMTRSAEGMQRWAEGSLGPMTRRLAETGGGSGAATERRRETKESEEMSSRDCCDGNDRDDRGGSCCDGDRDRGYHGRGDDGCRRDCCDDEIRLYEYTVVSIERGRPEVLDRGQKMVDDCTSGCDFSNWVIADYLAEHKVPSGVARYLRVYYKELDCWHKPAFHYRERQIDALDNIVSTLRLGRTAPAAT